MTHLHDDSPLPYFDTWRPRKDLARWYFAIARAAPSTALIEARNRWLWSVIDSALSAVSGMARPIAVDLLVALEPGEPTPALAQIRLPWHKGLKLEEYIAQSATIAAGLTWLAHQAEIQLEESICARAEPFGTIRPFHAALGSSLRVHAPWAADEPWVSFELGHSLYLASDPNELRDNQELHERNHPQLRAALERLAREVGELRECEGRGAPTPQGFA